MGLEVLKSDTTAFWEWRVSTAEFHFGDIYNFQGPVVGPTNSRLLEFSFLLNVLTHGYLQVDLVS